MNVKIKGVLWLERQSVSRPWTISEVPHYARGGGGAAGARRHERRPPGRKGVHGTITRTSTAEKSRECLHTQCFPTRSVNLLAVVGHVRHECADFTPPFRRPYVSRIKTHSLSSPPYPWTGDTSVQTSPHPFDVPVSRGSKLIPWVVRLVPGPGTRDRKHDLRHQWAISRQLVHEQVEYVDLGSPTETRSTLRTRDYINLGIHNFNMIQSRWVSRETPQQVRWKSMTCKWHNL